MTTFKYKWVSLLNDNSFKDLELPNKDDNWFNSEQEAIDFLNNEKQKDELFGDGICFYLLKMCFV